MPVRKPIRAAIVGAGWVATKRHLGGLQRAGVDVVAVMDRHMERAETLARRAGEDTVAVDSLEAVLETTPDLVCIATPPFVHQDLALASLATGAHVFVEKPMAMSLAEAESMAAAAKSADRLLCVSHNLLYSRAMQRVRRVLDSRKAGAIRSVLAFQSSGKRRLPDWYPELPGGLFFDESPHMLYLLGSLLGEMEVVGAMATRGAPGARQPFSTVQAMLRSNIAPATLTMTFDAAVSEWHVVVICERRVLAIDLFRDISIVLPPDGSHRAAEILRTSALTGIQHSAGVVSSGIRVLGNRQDWGHGRLIGDVVDAVRHGRPSPVPMEDSLRVSRLTDEILAAIA